MSREFVRRTKKRACAWTAARRSGGELKKVRSFDTRIHKQTRQRNSGAHDSQGRGGARRDGTVTPYLLQESRLVVGSFPLGELLVDVREALSERGELFEDGLHCRAQGNATEAGGIVCLTDQILLLRS